VQQALRNLKRGRTTFVIAHRLATVRDADLILVFKDGRIVERGTFEALAHRGGFFSRLMAAQFQPVDTRIEAAAAAPEPFLAAMPSDSM